MFNRHTLAAIYETRKATAIGVYARTGHSPEHRAALDALERAAKQLHIAEQAAGVPVGSTRA